MGKLLAIFQVSVAGGLLLWAVYMAVSLLAGGYGVFYTACFGVMAIFGHFMLRLSLRELKGGGE